MIQVFKRILPNWALGVLRPVRRAYLQYMARHNIRKAWINRKVTPEDNHLEMYWNASEQPNRILLIELLYELLYSGPNSVSKGVLEYGSHVGLNLKLLSEKIQSSEFNYYAVEPNLEAIQFLKSKLSFVETLNEEDEGFCRANFPKSNVTLSFVNSVFYCMTAVRTKAVLTKLASISEILVIGDAMENLEGRKSRFCADPVCYQHPYKKWLSELGFNDITHVPAPTPSPQLNGYIIAKRAG